MRLSFSAPVATAGEVFALIRDGAATTRSEVGRITGLSRTAVAARVSALEARGLVVENEEGPSTGGRPPARLTFNSDAGVVLAAAIGRSRTRLGVCDLAGRVLAMADLDQEVGTGPNDLMPDVVKRLEVLLDELGRGHDQVLGVGLSIPGTADRERGCSLSSPIMSGWDGIPLAPYFETLTSAPVLLDNDANAIVLSEKREHRANFENVLLIKASTGLGAGIVAGGVVQRGALGAAGEFGHTKTQAAVGVSCRCGDTGCLEAVAGGWALVRRLQEQGRPVGHIRAVVDLAIAGDPEARRLIRESGRLIGEVLAGAVNLLNPEVLVVGGDMSNAYDTFVAGLRETLYGNAAALVTRELQIRPSTHGEEAGVIGSAAMILDHVLSARAVDAGLG
ncbi:ROK family transcriptional regulator [Antrihabitans stalactiti]|uniref:ROK family protein n=1 Tax=Antrihabitans stalactiti TaxID=2584121 RepID=A0A848K8G4_9NOCA|nr:ROK family transcriptional regulator [Antrihabitans stalactiti]NMN93926.1 ROK family protein [Antrihabitans stalactiti]